MLKITTTAFVSFALLSQLAFGASMNDRLGHVCVDQASAMLFVKELVKSPQRRKIWEKATQLKSCRLIVYDASLEHLFEKTGETFHGGPWIFNFYSTTEGQVLITIRPRPIIINGRVAMA